MDNKEEEIQEESKYSHALKRFEEERAWYEHERKLLGDMKEDHQSKWKAFMQRLGRV